jgi:hypothetical protein
MPQKPPASVTDAFTKTEIDQLAEAAFETFLSCCLPDIHDVSTLDPILMHHFERVARVLTLEPATRTLGRKARSTIRGSHNQIDTWTLWYAGAAIPMEIIYRDWLGETVQAYPIDA